MSKIYFSQVDSRWKNNSYPSPSLPKATIGSGGCGVACASMIVSSFKDIITPDKMAIEFMNNGLRVNGGTSNKAFDWIAEKYGIKHELKWKLDEAMDCLRNGGMVVALCRKGLFTTGGHFIVLAGLKDENTILVYDPYLYKNKFNAYDRQGKAIVEGNNVYVTYTNMKEYGSYQQLWCYYPNGNEMENIVPVEKPRVKQMRVYNIRTALNIRNAPNGNIVGKLSNNTIVRVYETSGNWAKIGTDKWCSLSYLTDVNNAPAPQRPAPRPVSRYPLGKYVTRVRTKLNVRNAPINGKIVKQYSNGTRFDTYEIRDNWAKTPSGWVCLDFCKLVYKY